GYYDFQIDRNASGLSANVALSAATTGTLIGNWNADTNPTGTRTKPGLFGPFGADENLPVNVSLTPGISGAPNSATAGTFEMRFDTDTGIALLRGLNANLLDSGPQALDVELTLLTESFRTRNPFFIYPGGIPITVPLGQVSLGSLTVQQTAGDAPGVLTLIDANRYSFVVAPVVTIAGSVEVMGQAYDFPATPIPLPLVGEVEFTGDHALLTAVQPLDLSNSQTLDQTIPEFPLALPTLDPPNPANVLMNLVLSEVSTTLTGDLTLVADGLIPEPATIGFLLVGLAAIFRRQRT
ncbi:MAG: PEP-CTERM sorting domain-containing protein, partial [Planctomycetes bacterium]|nr:PEP-CTERM sorting domain-containing protein [Planctomycetota bacterium]